MTLVRLRKADGVDSVTEVDAEVFRLAAQLQWDLSTVRKAIHVSLPPSMKSDAPKLCKDINKKLKFLGPAALDLVDQFVDDQVQAALPPAITTTADFATETLVIVNKRKEARASEKSPPAQRRQTKPYKVAQQARGDLPSQLKQQAIKRKAGEYEESTEPEAFSENPSVSRSGRLTKRLDKLDL